MPPLSPASSRPSPWLPDARAPQRPLPAQASPPRLPPHCAREPRAQPRGATATPLDLAQLDRVTRGQRPREGRAEIPLLLPVTAVPAPRERVRGELASVLAWPGQNSVCDANARGEGRWRACTIAFGPLFRAGPGATPPWALWAFVWPPGRVFFVLLRTGCPGAPGSRLLAQQARAQGERRDRASSPTPRPPRFVSMHGTERRGSALRRVARCQTRQCVGSDGAPISAKLRPRLPHWSLFSASRAWCPPARSQCELFLGEISARGLDVTPGPASSAELGVGSIRTPCRRCRLGIRGWVAARAGRMPPLRVRCPSGASAALAGREPARVAGFSRSNSSRARRGGAGGVIGPIRVSNGTPCMQGLQLARLTTLDAGPGGRRARLR